GRPRRSPEPPAGRALGRPAAARRDRARARLAPDRRVRGRADRQPRLGDERGDPPPHAAVGRRLRPDDRHGHARPARGRDRRPHPLPRRRPDRPRAPPLGRGRGARGDERAQRPVIGVSLKGLAGRKLRSALTALAIVLGVAMISGTFILTDTINKGFRTIFTESYKNTS